MNIGYACINNTIAKEQGGNKTFRLASYTDQKLHEIAGHNIKYLRAILEFNVENNIKFFRISSDLVPFASHEICTFPWQEMFSKELEACGDIVKAHNMRVSLHPDQFVLINSPSEDIFHRSVKELLYQVDILNLMKLDTTHKLQIHVGGVYGDKEKSVERFVERYTSLPQEIKDRLVIENDDRLYSLKDCMELSQKISVPILFDTFHHLCLNNGEAMEDALAQAASTWKKKDGVPIMDYSSQDSEKRMGAHTQTINIKDFKKYVPLFDKYNVDVMLEIKDKEKSALKAINML